MRRVVVLCFVLALWVPSTSSASEAVTAPQAVQAENAEQLKSSELGNYTDSYASEPEKYSLLDRIAGGFVLAFILVAVVIQVGKGGRWTHQWFIRRGSNTRYEQLRMNLIAALIFLPVPVLVSYLLKPQG